MIFDFIRSRMAGRPPVDLLRAAERDAIVAEHLRMHLPQQG